MTGVVLFIMLVGCVLGAAIASGKNRSAVAWGICGALFPAVAVIVLLAVGPLPAPEVTPQ